jgi:hypothetical protein
VRVYLPATFRLLGTWLAVGYAAPPDGGSSIAANAVTPSLREWYREADLDELEHAAQVDASIGSLQLLLADDATDRRRVVVAADVAEGLVEPHAGEGRSAVRLMGSIPVSCWASGLVDSPDAETAVVTAVAAFGAAVAGDPDAQFAVDEAESHELGWYGVQELPRLLA